MQLTPDTAIRQVTLEIEAHVAQSGWDQPPRLYALVPTTQIVEYEPAVAAQLGIDDDQAPGTLTPIEQDDLPVDRPLESVLEQIIWPPQVTGCAAVLERLMLPPEAGADVPGDADQAQEFAANHPDRQEARIAAAVTRGGQVHCAVRVHQHRTDEPGRGTDLLEEGTDLLEGPDLVPGLLELLGQTLAD